MGANRVSNALGLLLALSLSGVTACAKSETGQEPLPSLGKTAGSQQAAKTAPQDEATDLWVGVSSGGPWLLLPWSQAIEFQPILHDLDVEQGIALLDGVPVGVDSSFDQVEEVLRKLKLVGGRTSTLAIPQSLLCSPPVNKAVREMQLPRLMLELRRPSDSAAGIAQCLKDLAIPELHLAVRTTSQEWVEAVSDIPSLVELRLLSNRLEASVLPRISGMQRLQTLSFSGTLLKEEWLAAILAMPSLEVLDISGAELFVAQQPKVLPQAHLRAFYANRMAQASPSLLQRVLAALPPQQTEVLELFDAPDLPDKANGIGQLVQLRSLRFGRKAFTSQLDLDFSLLPGLLNLDLYGYKATANDVDRIAGLKKLHALSLHGADIGDAEVKKLTGLGDLESLNLSGTGITDSSIEVLATLPTLGALYLANTAITDKGVEVLAEKATHLRRLVLERTRVGDGAARFLGRMKSLVSLNLNDTKLTNIGSHFLDDLPELRFLHLEGTDVSDKGIVPLAGLTSLQVLNLAGTRVSGAGLAALTKLGNLRRLLLDRCPLQDEAFAGLAPFSQLRTLGLESASMGQNLLSWVASNPSLRSVTLANSAVDESVFLILARSESITNLTVLDAQLTPEALFQIARIAPLRTLTISPQHTVAAEDFEPLQRLKHLYLIHLASSSPDNQQFVARMKTVLPGIIVE